MFTRFLDPQNDFAFKRIFGTEKNKDILIHFLNDVLVLKKMHSISEVTFLKPPQDPAIFSKKTSIVDILCKDREGNSCIVQMQVAQTNGFEKSAQYYASKAYKDQVAKEIIFLAITDYVMFPNTPKIQSDHVILDQEDEHNLNNFSFTFIELPKFNKTLDELSNIREKWYYFLKNATETSPQDLKKLIGHDPILEKAYQELVGAFWSDEELRTYEQVEKRTNDYLACLEQKFEEGKAVGRTLVKAKLIEEKVKIIRILAQEIIEIEATLVKEIAEIQKENILSIKDMACKLRERGISIFTIQHITKLSAEQIENL